MQFLCIFIPQNRKRVKDETFSSLFIYIPAKMHMRSKLISFR